MAFVHLHNHSDFSILDAATRISEMVKKAVDEHMPALALTDHGYMFGIPNFDLECRKYNDNAADMVQWRHDIECFQKGFELKEPAADGLDALSHDRAHAQWEADVAIWNQTHDLEAVKANKPELLIQFLDVRRTSLRMSAFRAAPNSSVFTLFCWQKMRQAM